MLDVEARARIKKLNLEHDKLLLDLKSTQRQLSWQGVFLEWLRAATVPAALLGVLATFFVGLGQVRQAEENRIADRFDKALTRLASEKGNERITGISGLRLFLSEDAVERQSATLHFLVNAISLETDPLVQQAIIDVLSEAKILGARKEALDGALQVAVQRNRALTASVLDLAESRIEELKKKRIATLIALSADEIATPIPKSVFEKLSLTERISLYEIEEGPFDTMTSEEELRIKGLAESIETLLAQGASANDFSATFCEACDFTSVSDLSRAKFDNAFLSKADFSHVKLYQASFVNADLGGTIFFSADLSKADLSSNGFSPAYRNQGLHGFGNAFPYLDCAELTGANLSGSVAIVLTEQMSTTYADPSPQYGIRVPNVLSAKFHPTTKVDEIGVIAYKAVTDDYLFNFAKDGEFEELQEDFSGDVPSSIVLNGSWSAAMFYRIDASSYAERPEEYTDTIYVQRVNISTEEFDRLRGWTKPLIAKYFDQPNWRSTATAAELIYRIDRDSKTGYEVLDWSKAKNNLCDSIGHPDDFWLSFSDSKQFP